MDIKNIKKNLCIIEIENSSYYKKYGLKYIVLRYMDVFEARQDYRSFTGDVMKTILN